MRWLPAVRTLPPYHDDPAYIGALKAIVEASLAALDFAPEALVASFHGMPQRTLELGDPYHCHCRKTARLLSRSARARELLVAFQSRFGRAKWLEPATDKVLAALPGKGVKQGRDRRAGLRRRLPRDARRAGDPRPRDLPRGRRHAISPICPASTTASRASTMLRALIARELEGWAPPQ